LPIRTSCLAGLVWLLLAAVVPGAHAAAPKKKVSAASAFKLPAAKTCVAKRALTIRLLKPRGVRWSRVTVTVGRKRVKTVRRPRSGASVKVAGLPSKGSYKLTITATDGHGRTATISRTYRACAAKVAPSPAPAPVSPAPVAPDGGAAPRPPVLLTPVSGSYADGGLSLYVSRDAKQIQDVAAPATALTCQDGTTPTVSPVADEIGLAADGSFSATVGRDGVVGDTAATLTYTFKGRFTTTTAVSGTWRVDVSGVGTSCTSGDRAWAATREAQPTPQPTAAPPAGGYAGADGLALYVSGDAQQVQDVADGSVDLHCTAGVADQIDHLAVDEIELAADGSLSASDTEAKIFEGKAAAATTIFRGHFHGTDADGNARAAGTWQRTITYDNASKTCTSNPHPWSATLAPQGSQDVVAPTAGSYAGPGGVSLFVSAAGTQVQDAYLPTHLRCDISSANDGDLRTHHIGMDEIAIGLDGAFTATTTRQGFFESTAATYTSTFRGHVHGTDAGGHPRLAGTWRETIVSNGGALTCTSGDQPWSAVRETQPTQTTGAPPDGAWSGPNGQDDTMTFDVAAGGTQIQNVTTPTVLTCQDAAGGDTLTLASVPIAGDGSFSATVTPAAAPGDPVYTYTFRGHLHATGADGKARAAGSWREDIVFDDGAGGTIPCTSNDQSWSAKAP
jgi:hypothetical protein